jgi:hypothetical protein
MTDLSTRIAEARAVGAKAIAVEIEVIERLIAERDEARTDATEITASMDQVAHLLALETGRADKATAEVARLNGLLGQVRDWLADPKLDTWPYMEGPGFYDDKATWVGVLDVALAETTP